MKKCFGLGFFHLGRRENQSWPVIPAGGGEKGGGREFTGRTIGGNFGFWPCKIFYGQQGAKKKHDRSKWVIPEKEVCTTAVEGGIGQPKFASGSGGTAYPERQDKNPTLWGDFR